MARQRRAWANSFWLALTFLTLLPAPPLRGVDARQQGLSLVWFPLVGLLLGLLLVALALVLPDRLALLRAALLTGLWVLLSGGLHLDGLADCADAWLGGRGDRERSLALMKDPHAGSAALLAVSTVLLVKFAALASLAGAQLWLALALVPALGRCVPAALLCSSPYARDAGLASQLVEHAPRTLTLGVLVLACAGVSLGLWYNLGPGLLVLWPLLLGLLWQLRRMMLARLGGVTGDTLGAAVEIVELAALVLLNLLANYTH
jgi:adenosylcobinamide-GDP ribazoletransferase